MRIEAEQTIVKSLYLENEWERTEPDLLAYIPENFEGPGACNQHFLVVKTPPGTLLGFWTQSTFENAGDQRVVFSRSLDRGRTLSQPQVIDGPKPDDADGTGLASWGLPIVAPNLLGDGAPPRLLHLQQECRN